MKKEPCFDSISATSNMSGQAATAVWQKYEALTQGRDPGPVAVSP